MCNCDGAWTICRVFLGNQATAAAVVGWEPTRGLELGITRDRKNIRGHITCVTTFGSIIFSTVADKWERIILFSDCGSFPREPEKGFVFGITKGKIPEVPRAGVYRSDGRGRRSRGVDTKLVYHQSRIGPRKRQSSNLTSVRDRSNTSPRGALLALMTCSWNSMMVILDFIVVILVTTAKLTWATEILNRGKTSWRNPTHRILPCKRRFST